MPEKANLIDPLERQLNKRSLVCIRMEKQKVNTDGTIGVEFETKAIEMTKAERVALALVDRSYDRFVESRDKEGKITVKYVEADIEAARQLLDRIHGKPKQQVETIQAPEGNPALDAVMELRRQAQLQGIQ